MPADYVFHLIPNAHLDPVWLWDWREGLNEGLITCRTILDLMDHDRDLTFIRGETAIYEHIERNDPKTFARIRKYVKAGRWDPVGGTVIQPDTNLPDAETFARHFLHGQRYLKSRFGKTSRVAWAADSFGHSAGLPEILAASGIDSFAFSRPAPNIVPVAKPAFWWEGPGQSRILAYRPPVGWYGCEREEMIKRLDACLDEARKTDLTNVGIFFGLGNHGGGPTRRHLEDIRDWAKTHPEIHVVFSGLHKLFASLRKEIAGQPKNFLPTHRGELNFVLRGCYSSVARFKFPYRKTENLLQRAERTDAIIGGKTNRDLADAWHGLLFNSFHDILPGSSIERAFDEQIDWIGGCRQQAREVEFDALNRLAAQVDTRVAKPAGDMPSGVALLVFNPHPHAYLGPVELEASLDYRPIWKYHKNVDALPLRVTGPDRKPIPFQQIETEHHAMVELAWRKRIVIDVKLPAFGWNVIEMAYDESAEAQRIDTNVRATPNKISNGAFTIRAAIGASAIQIRSAGALAFSDCNMSAITVEDPFGSWGGMSEEPDSFHLETIRHHWNITDVHILESGPLRASMWIKLEAGNSRLELTFSCAHNRPAVDVSARVLWNERSARLKLVIPCGDDAEFEVPAATVRRQPNLGQVPGGKWVRITGPQGTVGFASDALYDFDTKDGQFRATICRASRYADDVKTASDAEPWRAAVDAGELKFKFLLAPGDDALPTLARALEQPPTAILVPPHEGKLPRAGSLGEISPSSLRVLALKRPESGRGFILRLHETAGKNTQPKMKLLGKTVHLPKIAPKKIATFHLTPSPKGWNVRATNSMEV